MCAWRNSPLGASRQLYDQNRKQEEVGTMAHLDVVSAESEVAAGQRDLVIATTNVQNARDHAKEVVEQKNDPDLDMARIELTTQMPEPRDADVPQLEGALSAALANRPDLREAQTNLQNQNISVSYTRNNLRPNLSTLAFTPARACRVIVPRC